MFHKLAKEKMAILCGLVGILIYLTIACPVYCSLYMKVYKPVRTADIWRHLTYILLCIFEIVY